MIEDKRQELDPDEAEVDQILPRRYRDFRDVFSKKKSDELPPLRPGVDFKIEFRDDLPLKDLVEIIGYSPLYKQSAEQLKAVRDYLIDNLKKGFITPLSALFLSLILLAIKPGGSLRFCVDYRKLNAATRKDRYPLPLIDELLERLNKARVFTKLDIRQGFHRIRMDPADEDLTTFRTRYSNYKYKVLPFRLSNRPATFQRFINSIFLDYTDRFLTGFIDDLLIYSDNKVEHEQHVKLVLQRLREAGLQAAIHKCEFHVTETKYLGFIVSTTGIRADPTKTAVVRAWSPPTTVREVQSFLGFCNFYRRFIRDYSRIARPLSRLTRQDVPYI